MTSAIRFAATLTAVGLMASTSGAQTVTYTYDAQGRVKTATQPGAASAYTYDKADNRTQIAVSTTGHAINTVPDSASIPVSQWVDINAKNNDADTLGHALTITGINQQGVLGNAVVQSNGTIRYTAGATAGTDTVKYTVSDGQISAIGTITVTVTGAAPTVAGGSISIANNASNISLPLGISGGATSVSLVTLPTQGQATPSGTQILYTPYAGGARSDSLTFTASNANGTSNVGTVSISIAAPAVQKPVANTSSATVAANSASNVIPLNITGSYTSVAYVTGTSHGSVQAVGAQMYYTPFTNYFGPDSFTYTATNASGTSNVGTANLTVSPPPPTANNISATVAGNSSNNTLPLNFTGGSPTSVQVYSPPSHGTATVSGTSILYTPTPGYSGSDGFYYRGNNAAGWGGSALASITVTAPNQSPIARENRTDMDQSQTVSIDPRLATPNYPGDSDPDGDPLTITSVTGFRVAYARVNGVDYDSSYPFARGTLNVSGQNISYTAPYLCSFYGCYLVVVFDYTISDGRGGTSTAPHVINVYSKP